MAALGSIARKQRGVYCFEESAGGKEGQGFASFRGGGVEGSADKKEEFPIGANRTKKETGARGERRKRSDSEVRCGDKKSTPGKTENRLYRVKKTPPSLKKVHGHRKTLASDRFYWVGGGVRIGPQKKRRLTGKEDTREALAARKGHDDANHHPAKATSTFNVVTVKGQHSGQAGRKRVVPRRRNKQAPDTKRSRSRNLYDCLMQEPLI